LKPKTFRRTATVNDNAVKSAHAISFLALRAFQVGVDHRVADGSACSVELDTRGVHVPNIVAVASDGSSGGHCRRSGQERGSGMGRLGSSGGASVGGRDVVGEHSECMSVFLMR